MTSIPSRLKAIRLPALGEEKTPPTSGDRLPMIIYGVTLLTVVVGTIAKISGHNWRAASQPLFIQLDPAIAAWAVLSVVLIAGSLFAAFRLIRSTFGAPAFATSVFGLALLTRLALNVARAGPHDWYRIYEESPGSEGHLEYLSALPFLNHGVGHFLDSFAALVPVLPVHPAGHPPGMVLLIHYLGIDTPQGLAALTIVVGALAVPVLYFLARRLFDERTARVAALLCVFVPTSLLYGATSADALYATLALVSAACLLSARRYVIVIGAIALAVASFFSYALIAVGGWAGLIIWRRDGFRPMLGVAAICGGALIAFYLVLFLATGFSVTEAIRATNFRYHDGIAHVRPYWFWFFGSPAAYLIMLGPVGWYASRSLASRETTALALAAIILVAVVAGYTKAETERIWLFLVPLACLAAARGIPDRSVKPILIALASQAMLIEVLFNTRW